MNVTEEYGGVKVLKRLCDLLFFKEKDGLRKDIVGGAKRCERGRGKELIHCQVFTVTVRTRRGRGRTDLVNKSG